MKKLVIVFLFIFSLCFECFSQEISTKKNSQYETISWEKVEKTRKYEVNIERLNEKGKWVKEIKQTTKETSIDVSLVPGSYRVSITTFNILGKKTITEWTNFYILDEYTPYLFKDYFPKSSEWKVPVLYLNFKDQDSSEISGTRKFITAERGFDENTFFIKGKNIFTDDTRFYLTPSNKSLDGGKEYVPFYTGRKEVQLTVVRRDPAKNGVYVSYDKDKLFSGYYSLEARNGNSKDTYGIFVLADRPMSIIPEDFEQDARYKVNALSVEQNSEVRFTITGKGFSPNTRFSLVPTNTSGIPYPYAIDKNRLVIPVNLMDKSNVDDSGTVKIEFSCNSRDMRTGYYYIQADNGGNEVAKSLVLIKVPMIEDSEIQIKRIKTKVNKRTQKMELSLVGENLESAKSIMMVSEYLPDNDCNNFISLKNLSSIFKGSKFVTTINPEDIVFGDYVILIDTDDGVLYQYMNIDKHASVKKLNLNEERAAKKFLRPENGSEVIDYNNEVVDKVTFVNGETEIVIKRPSLFPYLRFSIALAGGSNSGEGDYRLGFDIFDNKWFSLNAGVKYNPYYKLSDYITKECLSAEISTKFIVPLKFLSPYIGVCAGYNLIDPLTNYNVFSNSVPVNNLQFKTGFFDQSDFYLVTQVGFHIIDFYDVKWNMEFHYFNNKNFQEGNDFRHNIINTVSIGVKFPLRKTTFTRNVVSKGVVILKAGEVFASDYKNISNVNFITFDTGVTEVNGFVNNKYLEEVSMSPTVEVIGPAAFKNCTNLSDVDLYIGEDGKLNTISAEAFAGDLDILSIYIPDSVRTIEKNAFSGWTSGQTIYLQWNKNDNTKRDLIGLDNTNAVIFYKDGIYNPGVYKNPYENYENWITYPGVKYSKASVYDKREYKNAIRVTGRIFDYDDVIKDSQNNILTQYAKKGASINFKVEGDGSEYTFLVRTSDGDIFKYDFKTKDEKISEISIPYSNLKPYKDTKNKKLNKNDIVFAQIVPSRSNTTEVTAYFFDFEVEK